MSDISALPASPVKHPRPLAERALLPAGAPSEPAIGEEPLGAIVVTPCGEPVADEPCAGAWRLVDGTGPVWVVCCDRCGFETGVPARLVEPTVRQRGLLEKAGLPAKFQGLEFEEDDDNRDALFLLRAWLRDVAKGDPLPAPAIWGEQGRGKSHLLTGLCTRLIRERELSVMFRPVRELLRELQRFDDDQERGRVWERAVNVDVLALDDLGAQQITDWRHDQLAHLIDERYSAERPVLVATNFKPSAWDQVVDARTASRLAGMTFAVQLKGRDRRQATLAEGAA